jgi:hypothetical protein
VTRLLLYLVRLFHLAGCKIEIGPLQRPQEAELDANSAVACVMRAVASVFKTGAFATWLRTSDYAILTVFVGSIFYIPSIFWGLAHPWMHPLVVILPMEAIVTLSLFPQFIASGFVFALLKRGDVVAAGMAYAFVVYAAVFVSARLRHSLTLDFSMLLMVVVSVRFGLAIGGAVRDIAALQRAVGRLQESLIYSRPSVRGRNTNT